MRNKRHAELLTRLVEHARYEVLPVAAGRGGRCSPTCRGTVITVTASPSKGLRHPRPCGAARGHGYTSCPTSPPAWCTGAGSWGRDLRPSHRASPVFVPGGDADQDGTYPDALTLLEDLADLGRPFSHVGITGYPSRTFHHTDDLTVQSGTSAGTPPTWSATSPSTLPRSGPGCGGCATAGSRCRCCSACRVRSSGPSWSRWRPRSAGESTRFLVKHKGTLARLAAPGGFTGERFLEQCARGWLRPMRGSRAYHHLQPDRRHRGLARGPLRRLQA